MAFTDNFILKGLSLTGAYFRIENVLIDTAKSKLQFDLKIYASQIDSTTEDNALSTYSTYTIDYDITGLNPFIQGYQYLKTTDDFKDATDVLEYPTDIGSAL